MPQANSEPDPSLAGPGVGAAPLAELARLLGIMARLRGPGGCDWDRRQDFASVAVHTVAEAHEVADAIAERDFDGLRDELGDLLLQVVFHSRMAEEAGLFDFAAVARSINGKMLRRHPHVFGDAPPPADPAASWAAIKAAERRNKPPPGIGREGNGLGALARAARIGAHAARTGFDWPDTGAVFDKLAEEVAELRAGIAAGDDANVAEELGDLMFVVANLARRLGHDPDACLRGANAKFCRRFDAMRRLAPEPATLAAMEAAWRMVKRDEDPV